MTGDVVTGGIADVDVAEAEPDVVVPSAEVVALALTLALVVELALASELSSLLLHAPIRPAAAMAMNTGAIGLVNFRCSVMG
ncbi:hypothetical protein [Nocardia camponoti]|nr:hypothetical protein [Nocardia camponoti]